MNAKDRAILQSAADKLAFYKGAKDSTVKALHALIAQPAQPGWRSIESEPQDFASRLYLVNGFCVQGFVDAAGILCAQNDRQPWRKMHGKPTHWMPLPPLAAPSTKEQTE